MSKTAADLLDTDTVHVVASDHRVGKLHTDPECHHLQRASESFARPASAFPAAHANVCQTCAPDTDESITHADPPDTRSWAYPGCPHCESDVFVERNPNQFADYRCAACERLFDSDEAIDDDALARIRADRDAEIRVEP